MLVSARRGISYPNPDRSDRPDIPAHMLNFLNALEVDMIYVQGTDAARVARAHLAGTFFYATDTTLCWYDDGAAWHQIGVQASGINLVGTYAARPAANSVAAGTRYFATDTLGEWRSDGAAWTLIDQGMPVVTPSGLSTFPGPYDGQLISLQVDATNGIYWKFRYNAGSASTYKWEFHGGPAIWAEVLAQETQTVVSSYADMTTAGPSVTLPRNGDYIVDVGSRAAQGTSATIALMAYTDLAGGVTANDDDAAGVESAGSVIYTPVSTVRKRLKTALVAGTLQAKYKSTSASGGYFKERWISATPVRIA